MDYDYKTITAAVVILVVIVYLYYSMKPEVATVTTTKLKRDPNVTVDVELKELPKNVNLPISNEKPATGDLTIVEIPDITKAPDESEMMPDPADMIKDGRVGTKYSLPNYKGIRYKVESKVLQRLAAFTRDCTNKNKIECWIPSETLGSLFLFDKSHELYVLAKNSDNTKAYYGRLGTDFIPRFGNLSMILSSIITEHDIISEDIVGSFLTATSFINNEPGATNIFIVAYPKPETI